MRKYLPETILATALLLLAGADLLTGGGSISVPSEAVFLKLRLPRLLTALIAGGALSLCGVQMQSIFRNPLADPHIMGISSGAGLGAAIAVAAGGTAAWSLAGGALAGAFLTAAAVMAVSFRIRSATTVLLTGVMTGFILSAATSVIQYRVSEQGLKVIYSWASGNFAGNDTTGILVMAGASVIGLAIALSIRKGLDILLFGEEFATLSGAPVNRICRNRCSSRCQDTDRIFRPLPDHTFRHYVRSHNLHRCRHHIQSVFSSTALRQRSSLHRHTADTFRNAFTKSAICLKPVT